MWLLVFVSLLCLLPIIYWYYVQFKFKSLRKIPGPDPIPFIGNKLSGDPCEILEILSNYRKNYGSLYKMWTGPFLRIIMSNPNDLEALLTSNIHITKGPSYNLMKPWIGEGLLVLTGSQWKRHRRIITPTFHFNILEEFMKIFNKSSDHLVNKLRDTVRNPEVNIYEYAFLHTLDIICETSMGANVNALNNTNGDFVKSTKGLFAITAERVFYFWKNIEFLYKLFAEKGKIYQKYLKISHSFSDKVIRDRKQFHLQENRKLNDNKENEDLGIKKKNALIDTLLSTENTLTDKEIRDEIMTFIFEGQDTSATGIGFCLYALAQHQDIQQTLYEEIESYLGTENKELTISEVNQLQYLDMVVKESQRLYPSVPFIERELESEFEIGGITYPKGITLSIDTYQVHHDPEIYPNPDKFDPKRFLPENVNKRHRFAYLPFSAGPRNCIGQKFATLEVKTTVIKILRAYRLLPVPGHKLKLGITGTLNSFSGNQIRLQPRTN